MLQYRSPILLILYSRMDYAKNTNYLNNQMNHVKDVFQELDVDGHVVCPEGDTLASANRTCETSIFDVIIGHVEDIIVDDEFQLLQRSFLEKYWQEFDDAEENKLVYTDIFNEYISVVEDYVEKNLNERVPEFSMSNFLSELLSRRDSLDGEVFEMLYTFSDFGAFKEMFIDYKAVKEGAAIDLSPGMIITSLHYEED